MDSIHFEKIGPLVSYHGIRQPAFGEIEVVLEKDAAREVSDMDVPDR